MLWHGDSNPTTWPKRIQHRGKNCFIFLDVLQYIKCPYDIKLIDIRNSSGIHLNEFRRTCAQCSKRQTNTKYFATYHGGCRIRVCNASKDITRTATDFHETLHLWTVSFQCPNN